MNAQEIELKIAIEEMERERDMVGKRLIDVMEVVDVLKSQVSLFNLVIMVTVLESAFFLFVYNCY
jgi:hypothetical protein